ncbi:ribose/xylose/arabinose/galactoside ABC-type transport system permease subunit [Bradyrhizobium ottawaense]
MSSETALAAGQRARGVAPFLRSQMRNIAPFLTLIFLSGFFAFASPSFATLDNLGNILTQVSVTGIIAVGLTFVILCAEIDLSIASIANVTGIAVAYFTLQESYVNIANIPLPGAVAIILSILLCALLGLVNALGLTVIGIPSFIMTLAMMQIAAGISALLVRGQIAYKVPSLITTLGSGSIGGIPWLVIIAALMLLGGHLVLTYTRFGRYVYMVGGNREAAEYSGLNVKLILGAVMGDLGGVFRHRRHAGRRPFRQRAAERVRHLSARLHRRRRGRRHQPVRRPRRHWQHHRRAFRSRCSQ